MVPPSPAVDYLEQLLIGYLHARHKRCLGVVNPSYHLDPFTVTIFIILVVPSPCEVHERVARLACVAVTDENVLRPTVDVLCPRHYLDGVVALIPEQETGRR